MKKICILAVMLITNLCTGYFTGMNQTKMETVVPKQNTEVIAENQLDTEIVENEIANEVLESDLAVEDVKSEVIEEKTVSNVKQESIKQEVPKTEVIQSVECLDVSSQEVPKVDNSQVAIKQEVPETKPKEKVAEVKPSENKEVETPTPKSNPTPADLTYWCVEGGSHHVLGDGANEHGYYSSWAEAESACNQYMQGWLSEQHKIDQCACGLYYFWAIQE